MDKLSFTRHDDRLLSNKFLICDIKIVQTCITKSKRMQTFLNGHKPGFKQDQNWMFMLRYMS